MRIGLFYQIQVPKPWTAESESQRIYEALEQIPYAEQQGFESVWFSEHHFRPVWSHNSAPDLTLAAVSQRTSRIRLGVGVVLAPIHHPLHIAQRMATLDILSHGRVDVGLGRTGYPYQLTPYGTDLRDTRGIWQEFADVLPRIWTQEEIAYDGTYYQIPRREVLPKPVQRPYPPLWSACGSDETAHLTGNLGMGGSSPGAAPSSSAGTSSSSVSALGWCGATMIPLRCRPIIRATTRATSVSPAGPIRASPRRRKCVSRVPSSASAHRRTASGFSNSTKP